MEYRTCASEYFGAGYGGFNFGNNFGAGIFGGGNFGADIFGGGGIEPACSAGEAPW